MGSTAAWVLLIIVAALISVTVIYRINSNYVSINSNYVRKNSVRYEQLVQLNAKYRKHKASMAYVNFHLDSVAKFRRFDASENMRRYIRENENSFRQFVETARQKEAIKKDYETAYNKICGMETVVPDERNRPSVISSSFYQSYENKIIKSEHMIIDPPSTLEVFWEYTSPAGRNRYKNSRIYNWREIESMLYSTAQVGRSSRRKALKITSSISEKSNDVRIARSEKSDDAQTALDVLTSQRADAESMPELQLTLPAGENDLSLYKTQLQEYIRDVTHKGHDSGLLLKAAKATINTIDRYNEKKKIAFDGIDKLFPPPQLAHDRFYSELEKYDKMFVGNIENLTNIVCIATEMTDKIDVHLDRLLRANTLISKKLEEFTIEITLKINNVKESATTTEIDELMEEMQQLVDSVKEYE
jgi:hypothetical protein